MSVTADIQKLPPDMGMMTYNNHSHCPHAQCNQANIPNIPIITYHYICIRQNSGQLSLTLYPVVTSKGLLAL
jgi:hypothetical protein